MFAFFLSFFSSFFFSFLPHYTALQEISFDLGVRVTTCNVLLVLSLQICGSSRGPANGEEYTVELRQGFRRLRLDARTQRPYGANLYVLFAARVLERV